MGDSDYPVCLHWQNLLHVTQLFLAFIAAAVLAPVMDTHRNTNNVFYSLVAWACIDTLMFFVYYDALVRISKMDDTDIRHHYTLRYVIAITTAVVFFCECLFLFHISLKPKGIPVKGIQLAAGVVSFVCSAMHFFEFLLARYCAKHGSLIDDTYEDNSSYGSSCSQEKKKAFPPPPPQSTF